MNTFSYTIFIFVTFVSLLLFQHNIHNGVYKEETPVLITLRPMPVRIQLCITERKAAILSFPKISQFSYDRLPSDII